jgi:DDE superfamily endonuclease
LVQPLDVSINKPFKDSLRNQWTEWFATTNERTPGNNHKPPTRQNLIEWISLAWEGISASVITASFEKCGLPQNNLFDETTDAAHILAGL